MVVVFSVVLAIAFPLYLYWGRRTWFSLDDFDFLAQRTAGNFHDLFRAHQDHWTTLPMLVYRALWSLVGIKHYFPYQMVNIAAHLATAALLFVIMRRAHVLSWIAASIGTAFVFFGSGAGNILSAFQITFVGALAFGLVHLILADHDGPLNRNDWLGLGAGLAALMCSGVGVVLVGVVALATLLRRGWRAALFHLVPLASAYVIWYFAIGERTTNIRSRPSPSISGLARYSITGIWRVLGNIGELPAADILLAALLIVGLAYAVKSSPSLVRRQGAVPLAMLCGAVAFLLVIGQSRDIPIATPDHRPSLSFLGLSTLLGPARSINARYIYVVFALVVPAIALAANAIARRWRHWAVTIALAALLLAGIPGNVLRLQDHSSAGQQQKKETLLIDANLPLAAELPRTLRPVPDLAATMGWLVDNVRAGRVPRPRGVPDDVTARETLRLALQPGADGAHRTCSALPRSSRIRLSRGDAIVITAGSIRVRLRLSSGVESRPRRIPASVTEIAVAGPLLLDIALGAGDAASRCRV